MDLSKCKCDKPGMCPVFGRIMGEDPPDWKWCQTAPTEDKKSFYDMTSKNIIQPPPSKQFITINKLYKDLLKLLPDVQKYDGIVGIPRSGMIPASLLSTLLSKPLFSVINDEIHMLNCSSVFGGSRMRKFEGDVKNLVFVDDTVYSGETFEKLEKVFGDIKTAVVYAPRFSCEKVDYFADILNPPHILEWNFFNSGYVEAAIFDIDGILSKNVPIPVCENEALYIDWLKNVEPYYHRVPRLFKINKLVTGRLERYRDITEEWLQKNGIQYGELVMFPTELEAERNKNHYKVVGKYKAEIYNNCDCRYFVESELSESKVIKEYTDKSVICPDHEVVL